MKVTPLEIRQKTFEKSFRGYDKEEVSAYLLSLSKEWENLINENKDLKNKLELTELEVKKLRDVESSLFKTLKTAEDTGSNMVDQAKKDAALLIREAQVNADSIINDAKNQSQNIVDAAEEKANSTS